MPTIIERIGFNMRITLTTDLDVASTVRKYIKENDGYCQYADERTQDTKCMCKEFLEMQVSGYCNCGLYYKEI